MIYRVSKDLENGGWESSGNFTGEVHYQVITSASDGLPLFYNTSLLKSKGLPVRGDRYGDTLYVSSVSFERAEERNFKDNGKIGNTEPVAVWDYVASIAYDDTIDYVTGQGAAQTTRPTSLSISPKSYIVYDAYEYRSTDLEMGKPSGLVTDTAGTPMSADRTVYNTCLNFTYRLRKFDPKWMYTFMGSRNDKDMTICGVPIPKGAGRINNLTAQYDEGTEMFNVTAEIELYVQYPVAYEDIVSMGYYAKFDYPDGTTHIQRIQRITKETVVSSDPKYPGRYMNTAYGYWGPDYVEFNVEDRVVLDSNGYVSTVNGTRGFDLNKAYANGTVGKVTRITTLPRSWKYLEFPKKGFKE